MKIIQIVITVLVLSILAVCAPTGKWFRLRSKGRGVRTTYRVRDSTMSHAWCPVQTWIETWLPARPVKKYNIPSRKTMNRDESTCLNAPHAECLRHTETPSESLSATSYTCNV